MLNTKEAMQRARKEFGPPRPAASTQEPEHDFLTAEELAALWRCTKRQITNQAAAGNIPGAFRVGKYWRFHRKKLFSAA